MNVLITSGGCREFIDAVRFITNFSTGATGAFLADFFHERGAHVHLLSSVGGILPKKVKAENDFTSFQDLNEKIKFVLSHRPIDLVIHVAAVSDFSIVRIEQGTLSLAPVADVKLASDEPLVLRLKPNFKILSRLKSYAGESPPRVVAFKLTRHRDEVERANAVMPLFQHGEADWVIHNDLTEIDASQDLHRGKIYSVQGPIRDFHTKQQMAEGLWSLVRAPKSGEGVAK